MFLKIEAFDIETLSGTRRFYVDYRDSSVIEFHDSCLIGRAVYGWENDPPAGMHWSFEYFQQRHLEAEPASEALKASVLSALEKETTKQEMRFYDA